MSVRAKCADFVAGVEGNDMLSNMGDDPASVEA